MQTKLRQDQVIQPPAFRNLLVDGAMRIAQAGTSTSGISTSSTYLPSVDMIPFTISGMGTWTLSQDSTDSPKSEGFAKSFKLACTTANASPAASAYLLFDLGRIEGRRLQHLKKGTANAKSLTLSFLVRSSKTGNFVVQLRDGDNDRHICSLVTINSANTWEKKTIKFAGDTSGVLDDDNELSIFLRVWLGAGSDYTSGTLATSWATRVAANQCPGISNWADSTANNFYITGAQLEIGDQASEFEHLPFDVLLRQVQSYYLKFGSAAFPIVFNGGAVTGIDGASYYRHYIPIYFPTTMRATPTVAIYSLADTVNKTTVGNSSVYSGDPANVDSNVAPSLSFEEHGGYIISRHNAAFHISSFYFKADARL